MQQHKHTISHLKLKSTLKNVATMSQQIILLSVTKLGENLAFSIASKLTGKILSEATLDVCHCHSSWPSRPKHIPKGTLRQSLCLCAKVPFHEIPLPQFLKLGKWCWVQSLDYMAGVGWDSHHMNVICLHAVKEGYIINVTPVCINNEQMWPVK